jgi:hypothetical protein
MTTDLDFYDEMYDDVEEANQFEPVPDGTYQVFVDEVSIKETKKEPIRPMLTWQFKIMGGVHEGRILFKNAVIPVSDKEKIERALSFIKTDLSVCGLTLKKFSDLQKKLGKLLNVQLEVGVKNKGDNQNVYIQRALDAGEVQEEDSIPF